MSKEGERTKSERRVKELIRTRDVVKSISDLPRVFLMIYRVDRFRTGEIIYFCDSTVMLRKRKRVKSDGNLLDESGDCPFFLYSAEEGSISQLAFHCVPKRRVQVRTGIPYLRRTTRNFNVSGDEKAKLLSTLASWASHFTRNKVSVLMNFGSDEEKFARE